MELPCAASGYPIPAIRWLKDGRPLPADSRWAKRITGLTISDLRTEDSGTYICEVTNTFGSAEANGILTVIGESGLFCSPRRLWEYYLCVMEYHDHAGPGPASCYPKRSS